MSTSSRAPRALCLLICGLAAAACQSDPARLRVQVCGDLRLGADVDAIRVTVRDEDRTVAYSGLDELVAPVDAGAVVLPDAALGPDAAVGADAAVAADASPSADAAEAADAGPVLDEVPACDDAPTLAADLALPPGEGRAWVEVQVLRDGIEVGRGEVRAAAGAALVALTRGCLGVSCPLGQTCRRGECGLLPVGGDPADCEVPCAP